MSDKFDKMSIYDIDWKTIDNEGDEQVFTFKPLPFKYYPRTYDLLGKLQSLSGKDGVMVIEELNHDVVDMLITLEKIMVQKSYPDLDEDKVDKFVTSNAFQLMEPLLQLINRQEVTNPRKAEQAKK